MSNLLLQQIQGTPHICVSSRSSSDLDDPVITVHQSVGEAKEQFYFERTVFLRCVASSNPPVHYTWRRGRESLSQGSDSGVEIYEPFFTQVSQLDSPDWTGTLGALVSAPATSAHKTVGECATWSLWIDDRNRKCF